MTRHATVRALTINGKIQVAVVRFLLFFVSLIKRKAWKFPEKNFEENPRYFKFYDVAYLSYKYFYSLLIHGDKNSGIEKHFRQQQFQKDVSSPDLTISLGGDLMPYQFINKKTCSRLWDSCGEFFFSSDIVFANLETPVDTRKAPGIVPEVMLNDMLFNADEEIFSIFNPIKKFKGFDVLSVANNHSLDQGKDGLAHTLQFLKNKNIAYCGAAHSPNLVNDFPVINKNGINAAFIAFTFSLNKFELGEDEWLCNHVRLNKPHADISRIVKQAAIARERGADIVILSLHMGNAYQAYPSSHIIDTIHRICKEAMIEVVVTGHPHNPQPVEWFEYPDQKSNRFKKSLIFYSLGDFVAYDIYSWAHLSLMVKLSINKSADGAFVSGFKILPAYMLAEFEGNTVSTLQFQHFETVYENQKKYNSFIQYDLQRVNLLYRDLLFTEEQRESVIHRD
jgi:poly-gamma-glutamate synthesis protein (capsule biosynthesis protein)